MRLNQPALARSNLKGSSQSIRLLLRRPVPLAELAAGYPPLLWPVLSKRFGVTQATDQILSNPASVIKYTLNNQLDCGSEMAFVSHHAVCRRYVDYKAIKYCDMFVDDKVHVGCPETFYVSVL